MANSVRLTYLSHSMVPTGGTAHEEFWVNQIAVQLGPETEVNKAITGRLFSIWQQFSYLKWCWTNAKGNILVVSHWTALIAYIKSVITNQKVVFIWHHYDQQEWRSNFTRVYFKVLLWMLKQFPKKRIALVAVSPFWVKKFKQELHPTIPVFLLPNLFKVADYQKFWKTNKQKQIYLGKWADKIHPDVFLLAAQLTQQGWNCFFSTQTEASKQEQTFSIRRMDATEAYLEALSASTASILLVKVAEGWNRTAHESILVGTPVLAYPIGGLADLLAEANGTVLKSYNDAIQQLGNLPQEVNQTFADKYDVKEAAQYIKPLVDWLKA